MHCAEPKPAELLDAVDFTQLSRAEAKTLFTRLNKQPANSRCTAFGTELQARLGQCLMKTAAAGSMAREGLHLFEVDTAILTEVFKLIKHEVILKCQSQRVPTRRLSVRFGPGAGL